MPEYGHMPVSDDQTMTFMVEIDVEVGKTLLELADMYGVVPNWLILACIETATSDQHYLELAGRAFAIHLAAAKQADDDDNS